MHGPVCSHNEWDPLEEVIVGILDGASFPAWHLSLTPVLPANQVGTFRRAAETPFPQRREYSTLEWASTGMYAAMPRDSLLVVGEEIIECPMAWRSRYYESLAYRPLLKEYFRGGARCSAAPGRS